MNYAELALNVEALTALMDSPLHKILIEECAEMHGHLVRVGLHHGPKEVHKQLRILFDEEIAHECALGHDCLIHEKTHWVLKTSRLQMREILAYSKADESDFHQMRTAVLQWRNYRSITGGDK